MEMLDRDAERRHEALNAIATAEAHLQLLQRHLWAGHLTRDETNDRLEIVLTLLRRLTALQRARPADRP